MTPMLAIREQPFSGITRVRIVDEVAPSIADLLASEKHLPALFIENCEARINGELVPRDRWTYVRLRPQATQAISVTFTQPLHGGGNTWKMIAAIAVLVVAAVVAGPLGTALAESAFGTAIGLSAGVASALVGAAIAIGGSLAIAALTPAPSLDQGTLPGVGSSSSDGALATSSAASLGGNVLGRGRSIPRVLGAMRVFPPLLCPPLIEITGDHSTAEAVYGLAGPHAISDIRVGTTPIDLLSDIEVEIQEGLPNSPVQGLVSRQSFTDQSVAIQLSNHKIDLSSDSAGLFLDNQTSPALSCPQWEGFTTRVAPDEVWMPVAFPGGLISTTVATAFVPFRVRIRQSGATTWINLPEFHAVYKRQNPVAFTIKLMWKAWDGIHVTVPDQGGPVRAWYTVPTQTTVSPVGSGGWQANSYFYLGSGDKFIASTNSTTTTGLVNMECFTDRVEFYLGGTASPDLFPQSGTWEIQVMRGWADLNANITVADSYLYTDGYVHDTFGYYLDGSSVARIYGASSNFVDTCQIPRISSIWNEPPVPDPTVFATVSVRVRNRSVNELSVEASGYVYDWDGTDWATITTSSNPATLLHEVLTGSLGATPLPAEVVDNDSLVDWRTHCVTNSYECNAVVEGRKYFDIANMISGTGYARLFHNEKWGVFLDKDRSAESPIQIFSPRNMKDFKWTKVFTNPPAGIRASFVSSDLNYQNDEVIVYSDENNPDISKVEQITYDGLVTTAEVEARAAFDLGQLEKRMTFYNGTVDMESLVCQRGDLVGVQHDTLSGQAGFALVKTVEFGGGLVTGLVLDGTIPIVQDTGLFAATNIYHKNFFDFGSDTGVAIRLKNGGTILLKQMSTSSVDVETETTQITFTTPFADPGASYLAEGCLCTTGLLGSEYKRLLVHTITPNEDMTASITFVDEAPDLWA